jgi:leucyl-tRNA---protein transferase
MSESIPLEVFPQNWVQQIVELKQVPLETWASMVAEGWRHNGNYFFRISHDFDESLDQICRILPLRIRLDDNFKFSKSQRTILNKNADLRHEVRPAFIDAEKEQMFEQHIKRFVHRHPESIYDFVSAEPTIFPFKTYELSVFEGEKLVAVSFIDITEKTISSTYAMFDLNYSHRSLGIYTMLLELEWALANKKHFHYPGYAYDVPSFYDYKKRFHNTEYYDWLLDYWFPLSRLA